MYQKKLRLYPLDLVKKSVLLTTFRNVLCFMAVERKIYYLRIFLRMTDNTIMLPVIRKPLEFTKIIEKVSPTSI